MGAETFTVRANGKTAKEAFAAAVAQAHYDYGHRGYTGSIAEKREFTMIQCPVGSDPAVFAEHLIDSDDRRVCDKWGPAGCIELGSGAYLFFGWASS